MESMLESESLQSMDSECMRTDFTGVALPNSSANEGGGGKEKVHNNQTSKQLENL